MARTGTQKSGPPTSPTRQDQWYIRMAVNNMNTGAWDKKTGGEIDSDDNKYYPGGSALMAPISIGGRRTTGNVTLQRIYDRDDDHGMLQTLINLVGKGKVVLGVQPKDEDGKPHGKVVTYLGTLKRISMPDVDSESGTAALIEAEIIVAGVPVVGPTSN